MKFEYVLTSSLLNRAPIGAKTSDFENFIINLFEGSHTYEMLKNEDIIILNVCNPLIIAESVINDFGNYEKLEYCGKTYYYVKEAEKIVIIKVKNRKVINFKNEYGNSNIMNLECEKITEKIIKSNNKEYLPFNRADGLLVEIAVLYSRIKLVSKDEKVDMIDKIKEYGDIIKKVGSKEHILILNKFKELIDF
ncbi:DUF447 domain-containing protein [Methanococcus voltae]|uniref:DUF447 family protein n=1 Tax=Methanococcus voltae (strain ATCC BAA-1334 / A3) TaxID=456320 RepID=D7DUP6_METV3|nr:DUF447 domain-containing protein [Methanococcus voltae]MCS3900658.1 hypothetical protein [Methanococcus voltae]